MLSRFLNEGKGMEQRIRSLQHPLNFSPSHQNQRCSAQQEHLMESGPYFLELIMHEDETEHIETDPSWKEQEFS